MKVIVFNVAAESGGGLTILKKYYNEAFRKTEFEWHFVISTPRFESKNNVHIHNYPWIKKSWFHRLFFDLFIAHRIVNKLEGDSILSLQNLLIPFVQVKQAIYFHQILPFTEKKFGFRENYKFWIYQNIIGKLILYSINKADKVIVQANWIKKMFIEDYGLNAKKIVIEPPQLNVTVNKKFDTALHNDKILYFFPASAAVYKNHSLIVDVSKKLVDDGINNFEIMFTINGDENTTIKELKKIIDKDNLPIKFIGELSLTEVYEMYRKSLLLFPSIIETYGLPLEEAKMHCTPILVSDLKYAREVLNDYKEVRYFDPFTISDLYTQMRNILTERHEQEE